MRENLRRPLVPSTLRGGASRLIARAAARVHTSLLGPDALLTGDDTPMNGLLAEILVSVPRRRAIPRCWVDQTSICSGYGEGVVDLNAEIACSQYFVAKPSTWRPPGYLRVQCSLRATT